ncbi:hypothetical protein C8R44DRAFT_973814, partial [Mycena epipterygia]
MDPRAPNSQLAQELIDHILDFLHDSPDAWPARITFGVHSTRNRRLCARLRKSPHLIRHVHQLDIQPTWPFATRIFSAICEFPFTILDELSLVFRLTPSLVPALQQLLSVPTLRHTRIDCSLEDLSIFPQIWDRCSGLRHLELKSHPTLRHGFNSTHPGPPSPIRLESLSIIMISGGLCHWLMHPVCPLDFSSLRLLSISTHTELLRCQKFAPALATIEALDFVFPTFLNGITM